MSELESVLRAATPRVVSALARRYGDFDAAEDAAQEALLAALHQWPESGVPTDPRAWLIRVASRRLIDSWRSDSARRERETRDHQGAERVGGLAGSGADEDDSLTLILLCCHPALPRTAQVPLTLRAVGGLTTAQIGSLLLTSESTVAQRISRAKSRLREAGARFEQPDDVTSRLDAVLQVLYLVFTQGHSPAETATDAASEAIRLSRMLRTLRPDDGEAAGLLALMLLTRARAGAQTADGLVTLADQDRSRWDADAIREGTSLLEETLPRGPTGPYALQAAIAAVHAEAATWQETDWPQILALYDGLRAVAPSPVVDLNRAVAVSMVAGPEAALVEVDRIADAPVLRRSHRVEAVRAHLLERAGDLSGARDAYSRAAQRSEDGVERDYLLGRAAHLVERRPEQPRGTSGVSKGSPTPLVERRIEG